MSTPPADLSDLYCSQISQLTGEQLFGNATEDVQLWVALEYPRAWGAKALEESDLPAPVKEYLLSMQATIPGCRVQLIKQEGQKSRTGLSLFIASAQEEEPRTYRFGLDSYSDLLTLDLAAMTPGYRAADEPDPYRLQRWAAPLYLVCTNGKRDQCCAKFGLPIYRALGELADDRVWQTTHTGGHRFAPTLICLPHGVCYGRVTAAELPDLYAAFEEGRIHRLDHYRGRSCYARPVQAADYYVREQTGIFDLAGLKLLQVETVSPRGWGVQFLSVADGSVHRLLVIEEPSGWHNPVSCRRDKIESIPMFRLHSHEHLHPGSGQG